MGPSFVPPVLDLSDFYSALMAEANRTAAVTAEYYAARAAFDLLLSSADLEVAA